MQHQMPARKRTRDELAPLDAPIALLRGAFERVVVVRQVIVEKLYFLID